MTNLPPIFVGTVTVFELPQYFRIIELPSKVDRIYDKTFKGCVSLKTVILPDGFEEIYSEAFADCFSLKDLYLPDSIDKIESDAFKGCKNLKLHYNQLRLAERAETLLEKQNKTAE